MCMIIRKTNCWILVNEILGSNGFKLGRQTSVSRMSERARTNPQVSLCLERRKLGEEHCLFCWEAALCGQQVVGVVDDSSQSEQICGRQSVNKGGTFGNLLDDSQADTHTHTRRTQWITKAAAYSLFLPSSPLNSIGKLQPTLGWAQL